MKQNIEEQYKEDAEKSRIRQNDLRSLVLK